MKKYIEYLKMQRLFEHSLCLFWGFMDDDIQTDWVK
jgi:hypothetical protein